MKKIFTTILVVLFSLSILFSQKEKEKLYDKEVFVNKNGDSLKYRLLTPLIKYEKEQKIPYKYPLVLFLHGAGERGSDNTKQLIHGADLFIKPYNRVYYPCFVIMPQCDENYRWVEVDWKLKSHTIPKEMSKYLGLTKELLDYYLKNYPVDTSRIYVTGLSMGGYGTWDIISRFPDMFAAAAPICGGGDEKQADKIKNIPVWAFHGTKDKLVPVSRSRNMVNAVKKAGGNIKYTEYPNLGHLCWNAAYSEKDFLKWMFSQKKSK